MKTEAHASVVKSEVRRGALARHAAARLDAGRALLITGGIGMPRTWSLATRAIVDGFGAALEGSDERGERLLDVAVEGARDAVHRLADTLVERVVPDASLVACVIDRGEAFVASVGPCRAYLHRRGDPKRLTPRDESVEGLFDGTVARTSLALEPDDLIMLGSTSAFSVESIAKIAEVLAADPRSTTPVLASLLTEPAARHGVGAAAMVVRVH